MLCLLIVDTNVPEVTELSNITTSWAGFKIVGDNIDKNFRPSAQRYDNKTKSLHWFHYFAVKDWINFASYSDSAPVSPTVDITKLLVNKDDIAKITDDVEILISR